MSCDFCVYMHVHTCVYVCVHVCVCPEQQPEQVHSQGVGPRARAWLELRVASFVGWPRGDLGD